MRSEQVEAFILAAQHGSLTQAARLRGVSRSTLSASVQALEDSLNVELFIRSGNSLQLSSAGEAILADCQRLMHVVDSIERRCARINLGVEDKLRIARDDSIEEHIWRDAIAAMQLEFPDTTIEIYLVPAQEHQELLSLHAVDAAFGINQTMQTAETIATVPNVAVVSPTHPLATLPLVSEHDLQQSRQICLAYLAEGRMAHSAMVTRQYTAMTSYELIRDAIVAGHGWGILPGFLIANALQRGQLIKLQHSLSLPPAHFSVKYKSGPGKAALWLQQFLQQQLKSQSL